ncbi:MAG: hypothetical protein U0871_29435 [Gemmataceae bacterium]
MTIEELTAALERAVTAGHTVATFRYVKATGEAGSRKVFVTGVRVWFGRTLRHPDPGWLVDALDPHGQATRVFAVGRMSDWTSA